MMFWYAKWKCKKTLQNSDDTQQWNQIIIRSICYLLENEDEILRYVANTEVIEKLEYLWFFSHTWCHVWESGKKLTTWYKKI